MQTYSFAMNISKLLPAGFLTCVVSLAIAPLAFGQSAPRKPLPSQALEEESVTHRILPTEALEKYDDVPASLRRMEVTPRMISQHDVFTSFQVNVNANNQNIVGDAANEPSICVDPTNGSKIAIGWRQFNSVSSNFRQAGWGYSSNGGASWTFPGVLENNVFRSDPVLYADDTGRFYYLSLLQSFFDSMWRSLNGGQAWTNIAPADGGDKQWFVIDNTNSSGHGFQYQIWSTSGNNYGGRQFTRSTDGGFTWMDPINIPNSVAWGTPDVDSNGILFIGGINLGTSQAWCVRSSNAKNGAITPTFDQSTAVNLGGDIDYGDTINPGGLAGQVFLAVDRSGTNTNNNVYMLASVQPTGFTTGTDVMFVRSTNAGQTFSAPIRIHDDPINHDKWHWMGTLAVAPNGRIDSLWLDTRNATNNTDSQLFYSYSADGGLTWTPNVSVSNPFNPFLGYPNQNKMGDYMTAVSDNTGADVAYTATFNQEEDVYFVRVTPAAPTVQNAVSRKTHGAVGAFYVDLPLTGPPGIEPRAGGATHDYEIVVTFSGPVTIAGNPQAQVTSGTGTIGTGGVSNGGNVTVAGYIVTIPLTNVANAQTIHVTLSSVNRAGDVVIPMKVLIGDGNGNSAVNATDVSFSKARLGQPVDSTNFRADTVANGTINSTDVSLVKANVGTGLP